jgi:dTDP-4-amino-4,6-dideoxygalactose transaminase
MIPLFNINNYTIDTNIFSNLLHDKIVDEFENKIAEYVGAKYAVSFNSATNAIFLVLQNKKEKIKIPSILPPVVVNSIINSGNDYIFYDDVDWVGNSYILHDFEDYKIVDSAQKIEKNQFKNECNDMDLMLFSFYPTKPIGSCDGGIIVSNDLNKIIKLKEYALNGMSYADNNWERKINFPGYKMYMNSLQAYIAMKNFEKYEEKLEKLNFIRNYYNKKLNINNTSNHLYRIHVDNRDNCIKYLNDKKIISGIHYHALHLNSVYKKDNLVLKKSEYEHCHTLSIPFNEKLTINEIDYIIEKIFEINFGKSL